MKVTLICTVYNESRNIADFLDSIASLERLPDEFVVVDAGSTDSTVEQLIKFEKQALFPVKIIVEKGCNIARGRNIATLNATHEIIAVTDAGCRLDPKWLSALSAPFVTGSDVVGGWYQPDVRSNFESVAAFLTFPELGTFDENKFLPSSRSLAYRKKVWESVGGYPEWLTFAGEDTWFELEILRKGFRITFQSSAVVYWRPRSSLRTFIKQWYLYGVGDGEARQNISILARSFTQLLLILIIMGVIFSVGGMLMLVALIFSIAVYKFRHLGKWSLIPLGMLAFLGMRIAHSVGFCCGLSRNRKP